MAIDSKASIAVSPHALAFLRSSLGHHVEVEGKDVDCNLKAGVFSEWKTKRLFPAQPAFMARRSYLVL